MSYQHVAFDIPSNKATVQLLRNNKVGKIVLTFSFTDIIKSSKALLCSCFFPSSSGCCSRYLSTGSSTFITGSQWSTATNDGGNI